MPETSTLHVQLQGATFFYIPIISVVTVVSILHPREEVTFSGGTLFFYQHNSTQTISTINSTLKQHRDANSQRYQVDGSLPIGVSNSSRIRTSRELPIHKS